MPPKQQNPAAQLREQLNQKDQQIERLKESLADAERQLQVWESQTEKLCIDARKAYGSDVMATSDIAPTIAILVKERREANERAAVNHDSLQKALSANSSLESVLLDTNRKLAKVNESRAIMGDNHIAAWDAMNEAGIEGGDGKTLVFAIHELANLASENARASDEWESAFENQLAWRNLWKRAAKHFYEMFKMEITESDRLSRTLKDLRPEVLTFARLMERKLQMNEHKGTWKNDSAHSLWYRIGDEAKELYDAFDSPAEPYIVGMEAADVANFAMMVADVCGALSPFLEVEHSDVPNPAPQNRN